MCIHGPLVVLRTRNIRECLMAMSGEMPNEKLFLLFIASVSFIAVCDGNKEQNLEHIINILKGESDQVADEIYTWINKHKKGLQSRDHSRDYSIRPGSKVHKKEDLVKLIRNLKGESDHLANELYSWIDKHGKGFQSRDQSRVSSRSKISPNLRENKLGNERKMKDSHAIESKKKNLERLMNEFKNESDQVANEIYAWIDKHSKGLQSRDYPRYQSRDNRVTSGGKTHKKINLEKLIKSLKGESDHLANEIYSWIDKHRKGFQSRDHSRGHTHEHIRARRSIVKRSNKAGSKIDMEGESIQDVMQDMMSAPERKRKHEQKHKVIKKTNKSYKAKGNKKAKKTLAKKPRTKKSKKGYRKSKKNMFGKHVKRVKHVRHSKRAKIPRKGKGASAHVIKGVKKSSGLTALLKAISADPSKKIVVTKGKNDIILDKTSSRYFNQIPKSTLKKLIENIELNKYFNIDTYISSDKGKGKKGGKGFKKSKVRKNNKTSKKNVVKKMFEKSVKKQHGGKTVVKSLNQHKKKDSGNKMESSADRVERRMEVKKKAIKPEKKSKVTNLKTQKKRTKKLDHKRTKNADTKLVQEKGKGKEEQVVLKSGVLGLAKSKKNGKGLIDKEKKERMERKEKTERDEKHLENNSHTAHQKLSVLKEKIKKTNSLKFKVAKALLEHCETQNKLKRLFDNVNASLKEASVLAKAIGKKLGVNESDIEKFTTEHTEEAVQDFLNKIF